MTEAQYYKFKFDIQEVLIARERAENVIRHCATRQLELFKANGLDPDQVYRFDDASLSLSAVQDTKE